MVRTEREMVGVYGPVILTTRPAARGFICKYLLGLTPVFLAGLSLLALAILHEIVIGFPGTLMDSLQTIVPDLPVLIEICVLLLAPLSVLLFFVWLGDITCHPEIWTGAGLTLILSGAGALVMVREVPLPIFFQWLFAHFLPMGCISGSAIQYCCCSCCYSRRRSIPPVPSVYPDTGCRDHHWGYMDPGGKYNPAS
jgi:hypothetical protein